MLFEMAPPHSILAAGDPGRPRGLLRAVAGSRSGLIGLVVLGVIVVLCVGAIPWTFGHVDGSPRYDLQNAAARLAPPSWTVGGGGGGTGQFSLMGADRLGRDLFVRVLAGGTVSLVVGIAAALVSVSVGTTYGLIAGYVGGRVDAIMMRVVDVLYGLPNILLVVLLAVASDALIDEYVSRGRARQDWVRTQVVAQARERGEPGFTSGPVERAAIDRLMARDGELLKRIQTQADQRPELRPRDLSPAARRGLELLTLLLAIGGVSWLTMARVVRGQVLSLKSQPFIEAARAIGAPTHRIMLRHLLPNLVGPIVVYATLTAPQAILQESFLSFLGIGVTPPLPSWGNLAAEGQLALNPVRVRWWLAVFPCGALAATLLALNFVGEGLREALDPKRTAAR